MDITSIVRRLGVVAAIVALAWPLAGCYGLQAAAGELTLLARRRPVAVVIADRATPPALRARLVRVAAMRDFASHELGLPDNASYRGYVDVGREAVVWNVFAAAEFSVEPRRWCFPVVGCVEYRGYFSAARAQRYAAALHRQGDDVVVRGAAAYSTLGFFADPVLSTMLRWSDAELAGIMFHELTHQLVYVPGDAPFNEALANLVEQEGVRRWLGAQGRAEELAAWQRSREREVAVSGLFLDARRRLAALYVPGADPAALRAAKARVFDDVRAAYRQLRAAWGGYAGYDATFAADLNNATLVPVATYEGCLPGLRREFEALHGDLPAFYARTRALAAMPAAARAARVCTGA